MKWRRIEDKNGVTAKDLISHDPEMEELLRAAELQDSFTPDDIDSKLSTTHIIATCN
jgi:hypothetical protein